MRQSLHTISQRFLRTASWPAYGCGARERALRAGTLHFLRMSFSIGLVVMAWWAVIGLMVSFF